MTIVSAAPTAGATVAKNLVDRVFADVPARVPWNVHAEWRASSAIDPDRLVWAAAATMRRHPLLDAREAGDVWLLPADPPCPVVEVSRVDGDRSLAEIRGRLVSRPFDLRCEAPVRFAVVHHPAGDRVLAVADHAVVDGVGIGRTIATLVSSLLHDRPRPGRAAGGRGEIDTTWRTAHRLAAAAPSEEQVRRTVQRLHQRAMPTAVRLAPDSIVAAPAVDGYGVAYHELSAAAGRLLSSLPTGAATRNDLVVAAFCAAGMAWNRQRGAAYLPFSVGVPLNLRPARTWFDGVCNATVPWPVRIDEDDVGSLLRQVVDQLRPARAGLYSVDVRALLCAADRERPLSLRLRHDLATTTVVSTVPSAHLVRPDGAMAATPSRLQGGAPAPPSMGMTFAVVPDRDGRYRLSARYLLSRHTAAGASRFLASVDGAITRLSRHEIERSVHDRSARPTRAKGPRKSEKLEEAAP